MLEARVDSPDTALGSLRSRGELFCWPCSALPCTLNTGTDTCKANIQHCNTPLTGICVWVFASGAFWPMMWAIHMLAPVAWRHSRRGPLVRLRQVRNECRCVRRQQVGSMYLRH